MTSPLFSERRRPTSSRNLRQVDDATIQALEAVVDLWINRANRRSPLLRVNCYPCNREYSLDFQELEYLVRTRVPNCGIPKSEDFLPTNDTDAIFDLIELYYRSVSDFFEFEACFMGEDDCLSSKLTKNFKSEVNGVLQRRKIAFEMSDKGRIRPLGAPILSDTIRESIFNSGDDELDELLGTARDKFISRDSAVRREGLEKLWDAWERLKTVEPGKDKKASASALLDRAAQGPMRDVLETEALALRDIGNEDFMIRHTEVGKHPLDDDRHVDYLFHRLFSLVYLLLDATGRVGRTG